MHRQYDVVMTRVCAVLGLLFLASVPAALIAVHVFDDADAYLASLMTGFTLISTLLNHALLRIGRESDMSEAGAIGHDPTYVEYVS